MLQVLIFFLPSEITIGKLPVWILNKFPPISEALHFVEDKNVFIYVVVEIVPSQYIVS
jgi:hypothetical protein